MSDFERTITLDPAYDKRHPDPTKNYGIHGVGLRMILKGPKGATQFVLYTNWQLPHVQAEFDRKERDHHFCHSMPADLGYHAVSQRYESQEPHPCDILPSGTCYYDGSTMNAERIYGVLLNEGSEGVWRELEDYYQELFGDPS